MTPPVRPEPTDPRQARVRRNLARLKAANAPQEDIDAYLASERVTPEQELAQMPVTGAETARGAIGSAMQGATFNLSDEIVGAARGLIDRDLTIPQAIGEEREQLRAFRDRNPKTAFALEMGGGLLSGGAAAKAATAGVPVARQAGRILASGIGGGAVAGAGAGEDMGSRVTGGVVGAGIGGLLGALGRKVATSGVGDRVARATRRLTDAVTDAPSATGGAGTAVVAQSAPDWTAASQRAALRALGGETEKARTLLGELERVGMGDDVMLMNLGDDVTVRAARAAANQPGSRAGQLVNERLARQGGRLGEAVPRDIAEVTGLGGVPGPIRLQQMQQELAGRVRPAFEAFRALPEIPLDPNDEAQRLFIQRYVQPVIENRRLTGQLTEGSALRGEIVDAAFKNLQRDVRGAEAAVSSGTRGVNAAQNLRAMRDRVLQAIGATDPDYAKVVSQYALDEDVGKVAQEGFEAGLGFAGRPVGTITAAMAETTPAGQEAMRTGFATALQERAQGRASNVDLGDLAQFRDVARAVVGTPADRERFIEAFGRPRYEQMVERLMPKVRAAAQNAAARGNSTTTRQLLDALAFGDDAMLDAIQGLATGRPAGAIAGFVGQRIAGPLEQAYRLGVGKTAEGTADILTTSGGENVRTLLDLLQRRAAQDAAQRTAGAQVGGVVGRTVTPEMR